VDCHGGLYYGNFRAEYIANINLCIYNREWRWSYYTILSRLLCNPCKVYDVAQTA